MLNKIKNNVESELKAYNRRLAARLRGQKIPPLITDTILNFISRPGKRIRPILFAVSYFGFCKKPKPGIYTSAVGLELLHDFLLIHDDIIDRTSLRKGQPTMHCLLEQKLKPFKQLKFTGSDMALVIADIIYALALEAFMANREEPGRKLKALDTVLRTTALTGCGEAVELLAETRDLGSWGKSDVYTVYDLKTAQYTFGSPLAAAAELAGAAPAQINALRRYGELVGRAFQIKDDLLDMFASEKEIGKTPLTDLREGKKTLLIWYTYRHASDTQRAFLRTALQKKQIGFATCKKIRALVVSTGARDYASNAIRTYRRQAETIASGELRLRPACTEALNTLTAAILAG